MAATKCFQGKISVIQTRFKRFLKLKTAICLSIVKRFLVFYDNAILYTVGIIEGKNFETW